MIVKLNSVDISDSVIVDSLSVVQNLTNEVDTASFSVYKRGDRVLPVFDDDIEVLDGNTKLFGGKVVEVKQVIGSGKVEVYEISCVDHTFEFDRILAARTYTNTSVKDIIDDLITSYAPSFTTNNVSSNFIIKKIVFNQIPLSQCMRKLADIIKYDWYIDADKDVHFFDKFTNIAPFDLTDTNGKYVYKSLVRSVDGSQVVNRVKVRGGEYDGNIYTDIITVVGNDTKSFNLPYKMSNLKIEVSEPSQEEHETLGDDLQAYWKFDGNSNDATGNGWNGSDSNVSYDNSYGLINQGVSANGSNSQIPFGNIGASVQQTCSISLWLKTTMTSKSVILTLQNAGDNANLFLKLNEPTSGKISWRLWNGSSTTAINSTTATLNDGNWHHIVAVRNGVNAALYIDGNTTPEATSSSFHNINVGGTANKFFEPGNDVVYNGYIDEVGIWSRELTTQEVSDLYNSGAGLTIPFLVDGGSFGFIEKTVGIDFIDDFSNKDVLYSFQTQSFNFENPLTDGTQIRFSGNPKIPVLAIAEDGESISRYGIIEKLIRDNSIASNEIARKRAAGELLAFANTIIDAKFNTYQSGLRTGMILKISSDNREFDDDLLIKRIIFTPRTPFEFEYKVDCISTKRYELIDILRKIITPEPRPEDEREVSEQIYVVNERLRIGDEWQQINPFVTEENMGLQDEWLDLDGDDITWVYGYYAPTSHSDTKRMGRYNRDAKYQ